MNAQTPRRYKGTLLERAAEQFHLDATAAPPLPSAGEIVDTAPPVAAPEPEPTVPVAGPAPERVVAPAPEPIVAAEPVAQIVAPPPEPVVPQPVAAEPVAEKPEPATVPQPDPEPEVLTLVALVEPEPEAPLELDEPILRRGHAAHAPYDGTRRVAPVDREALAAQGLIVPNGPVTPLAEEFRLVKRQLLLTARAVAGADADRARMILVCSAQPDEGKTFCAINLALSMAAEKDVEILLVDADFAKPDVLDRLGIPAGPGLLDALSGDVADVEDWIVDTDIPQLSVLPAGTRTVSDTELLASDRARALLDGLAAANPRRIVILDSPPALAASPASVMALHVGQVMLVVRADRTTESDLREATAMLDGCEHIQLVLNAVSFQPGKRRFGSYYEEASK